MRGDGFENSQQIEEAALRLQLDKWFEGWSPARKPYTADVLRHVFAEGPIDVVDDFGDSVRRMSSFQEYAETWIPIMAVFGEWAIRPVGTPVVHLNGDLAVTTLTFVGGGTMNSGEAVKIAQHGTHIWRKIAGEWRIVHEHLTTDKVENVEG